MSKGNDVFHESSLAVRNLRKTKYIFYRLEIHTVIVKASMVRGTKRLVSVNICSVEGNSAGVFVSKISPGIFVIKVKRMPIIFGRISAVLGAIKAQLPFSEGKYQLLNSWNTIPFPTIFYHLNFQLPYPNRSNNVSSHKYPF